LGEVLGVVLGDPGVGDPGAGDPGVGEPGAQGLELECPESETETELERGVSPENRDFPL